MKSASGLLLLVALAACVSCAQPMRSEPVERAAVNGSRFEAVGTVTLHRGQPCTPQIMFDFRRLRSRTVVWLGAPMHESTTLTAAADHRNRISVIGTWHRGRMKECSYVEVTSVVVTK